MTIVIPMAGLSSRFTDAGYTVPKYMLYVGNHSLFDLAVSSFKDYFKSAKFIFVCREYLDTPLFIHLECTKLGIEDFKIVATKPTSGQAETVYKGVCECTEDEQRDELFIFNIDTFRFRFKAPLPFNDGYLECFIGSGANWSYAKTEDGSSMTPVIETAEKKEISNFCSTGLYYFRHISDFIEAYNNYTYDGVKEKFVAPLYNYLIQQGKDIRVNIIDKHEVTFCGIPDEYIECCTKWYN